METVPKDLRSLRACLVCSLIKVKKLTYSFTTFDLTYILRFPNYSWLDNTWCFFFHRLLISLNSMAVTIAMNSWEWKTIKKVSLIVQVQTLMGKYKKKLRGKTWASIYHMVTARVIACRYGVSVYLMHLCLPGTVVCWHDAWCIPNQLHSCKKQDHC